jgi:PAS domain S-box-containing protein
LRSLRHFVQEAIWWCLAPLLLLLMALGIDDVRDANADLEREATHVAKLLAFAVDQDLHVHIGALQVLAESLTQPDHPNLQEFYRQAQGFSRAMGSHVVVVDTGLHVLLNTRVPYGAQLPPLPKPHGRAAVPEAFATGQPAIGDIFTGPISGGSLFAVAVPVRRNDGVSLVLLSTLEAIRFERHLKEIALPDGWTLTLLDGSGSVMAQRASGIVDVADASTDMRRFITRSSMSSWSVRIDIPEGVYRASIIKTSATLIGAILLIMLTGILGGMVTGRRLSEWVASLAAPWQPGGPTSKIWEIESVRARLYEAARAGEVAAQTLRESEMRFRQMFREGGSPQVLLDSAGRVLDLNTCFERIFGYGAGDVTDLDSLWHLLCPDDTYRRRMRGASQNSWVDTSATDNKVAPMECRVTCKDGSERTVIVSSIHVGINALVTLFDISERILAEEALRNSATLYRHTLDNMLEGCQIVDAEWRFQYLNVAGAANNRQPIEALIGRSIMEVFPGIEATPFFATLNECMANRTVKHLETEFHFPDGHQGWFDVNIVPAPEGLAIFSVDITKSKLAEAALRQSQKDAFEEQRHARLAAGRRVCRPRPRRGRQCRIAQAIAGGGTKPGQHRHHRPAVPCRVCQRCLRA